METKRNLIVVPIEPLDERYTSQWHRRMPLEFKAAGYDVTVIDGDAPLQTTVKVGSFLDINSTVSWKASQLQKIAKLFNDGLVEPNTAFFFGDIEFWGLESVRLMADMNKVPVVLTGFLHAASYTREDAFAIAEPYQRYTEVGWIASLDKVFVGSDYHKQAVISRRLAPLGALDLAGKIVVTSNPIFLDEYPKFEGVTKQKKVLLTNRPDSEKNPLATLKLMRAAKMQNPDWEFVLTSSRATLKSNQPFIVAALTAAAEEGVITLKVGLTKEEYHKELSEAWVMISHSEEENYGYCIAEALIYGCVPLCWAGASHLELLEYSEDLLFTNFEDSFNKLQNLLNLWVPGITDNAAFVPTLNTNGMANIIKEIDDCLPRPSRR